MIDQLALPIRTQAPIVSPDDVRAVVDALKTCAEWLTAAEIAFFTGFTDRKVRQIAAAAMPQIVSFPGSPGYRLFERCTVEEINHCIEAFESQGRDMMKRAILYRQAYHRRFRGQTT